MWAAFEVIVNFYQATLIAFYVNRRCSLRNHSHLYDLALVLCMWLVITGFDHVENMLLDNLMFVFPLMFALYFKRGHSLEIVLWIVLLAIIFSVGSTATSTMTSLITGADWSDMLMRGQVRLLYVISANALQTMLAVLACNMNKRSSMISYKSMSCFLLSIVAHLIVAECLFVISMQATEPSPSVVYGSMGLIASIILTIVLYEIMAREAETRHRLELEAQTMQLVSAHQEEMRTVYSSMLSTQHDLRHRISAAENLLAQNGTDTYREAIELLKSTTVLNEYITGSTAADAVLATKTAVMNENNIKFTFSPCPLTRLPLQERDFVVLLSNILDNAIEAVMRLPATASSREVKLIISRNWDIFSLICVNDMKPDSIREQDGMFISSKEHPELHGYGIRSIQRIVEDAGGLSEFEVKETKFAVRIMLPIE